MALYGLIGFPLIHSGSVEIFDEIFNSEGRADHEYRLFPVQKTGDVRKIIADNIELKGLNVTIPHKISIIPFLDELDETASQIGAVNTIRIIRDGGDIRLEGYNTDVAGFNGSIDLSGITGALVLGTGGAAKAVSYVLRQAGIRLLNVSRYPGPNRAIGYQEINKDILERYTLIVNATPVGMFPDVNSYPPLPYHLLDKRHYLYDLVYNPEMTIFLEKGKQAGTGIMNGRKMLRMQAERSWEIWNSTT